MYKKPESNFYKKSYIVFICFIFLLTSFSFITIFIFNKDSGIIAAYADKTTNTDNVNSIIPQTEQVNVDEEVILEISNLTADIANYEKELASEYLRIVNTSFPLPEDYTPAALVEMTSNPAFKMEPIAALKLQKFMEDALAAGYKSTLISCYRDNDEQQELYNQTWQDNMNAGYTRESAELMTQKVVALAGQSESQTGLSINIAESRNLTATEIEESEFFKYATENIHKYGFVLRYPKGKEHITGFSFDPSYFRYVGDEHSTYIYEKKLTLEEYVDYLKKKKAEANQKLTSLSKNQDEA